MENIGPPFNLDNVPKEKSECRGFAVASHCRFETEIELDEGEIYK